MTDLQAKRIALRRLGDVHEFVRGLSRRTECRIVPMVPRLVTVEFTKEDTDRLVATFKRYLSTRR